MPAVLQGKCLCARGPGYNSIKIKEQSAGEKLLKVLWQILGQLLQQELKEADNLKIRNFVNCIIKLNI